MTNEVKIRELKAARGQEFAKGKANRDDKQIERLHDGINQLKAKING